MSTVDEVEGRDTPPDSGIDPYVKAWVTDMCDRACKVLAAEVVDLTVALNSTHDTPTTVNKVNGHLN